jgi:hypothetical protein
MDTYLEDEAGLDNPMDIAEAVLGADSRIVIERSDDGDLSFTCKGAYCAVTGFLGWREELPAVLLTVSFDLTSPKDRMIEAARLIAMINENLWLGHFDLWTEDGSIVFRHSIPMIGRGELSGGEVQALLAASLDAADRFFPAFDFMLRCGQTAEESIRIALFETIGEA